MGGDADNQQVDVVDGFFEVGGGLQVGREGEPGQVARVGVALVDLPGEFGVAGPYGAVVVAGQQGGDGRSPRSGSEYRDPHASPALAFVFGKEFNHRTSGRVVASTGRFRLTR